MADIVEVYADESCHTQHRFLVLGGVACEHAAVAAVEARFAQIRQKHQLFGEVKWTKVSRAKYHVYQEFVDLFASLIRDGTLNFHSLIVDTSEFDHKSHNQGSSEIGFNKLIYQLLLHKFGRLYAENHRLYVYLDKRTTKASLLTLQAMLNSGLAKQWDIRGFPIRRLDFRDSKSSDLFQANDLILGAMGHRKNGHQRLPSCSEHKRSLVKYIERAIGVQDVSASTRRDATAFTVWHFHYRRKGTQGPRP